MFGYFEPFFTFRFIIFLIFTALFFYDLFDLILWYRNLPNLARKYIKVKVLTLNWSGVKREIVLIILLLGFGFFIFWLNLMSV